MAKLKMQRVCLVGLKSEKKQIMQSLQRLEALDIKQVDEESTLNKEKEREIAIKKESIRRDLDLAKDSIDILKSYIPIKEPFVLLGRTSLDQKKYQDYEDVELVKDLSLAREIVDAQDKIKANTNAISHYFAKAEAAKPWGKMDLPMNFKGTSTTAFIMATIQGEKSKETIDKLIREKLQENQGDSSREIYFEITVVSSIDVLTYVTAICLKEDEELFRATLRAIGCVRADFDEDLPATEVIKEAHSSIENLKKENEQIIQDQIVSKAGEIENLRLLEDYESMRLDRIQEQSKIFDSKEAFVLMGYAPKVRGEELKNNIEKKYNAYVALEDVDPMDESVPILLHNNPYSAPLESVVESYSLPGITDIDPTSVISIFYYMMFGMMLSDAGYGLLIFATTSIGLLAYKGRLERATQKMLTMYWFCGIFTMFWGVMFGSYFGDLLSVVMSTFFHKTLNVAPVWFDPVSDPMRLLTFAFIIGIVHLFTGLFIKGIQLAKQSDYKALFAEVISWFGILIGCLVLLLSTQMLGNIFGYEPSMPDALVTFGKYLAIASALAIVVTNGSSRNIFVRLGQGLYSLYGISSYLSDVLSYSRLLALGLATGVIASVINMMGSMVADGIGGFFGAIVFIAIMIFGHLANFAINALGAYVHTNRLQYVELFSKFYDGGGHKFSPLKMNTKYYKFEER